MSREQKAAELIETVKSVMASDTGLRPSQVKALHQFTDREKAPYRGIFNLATGVGKTRIMSILISAHSHNYPDSQIVVVIPSMELFQQEMDEFQNYKDFQDEQREKLNYPALRIPEHLDMGAFNQFDKNTTSQIIFTTYQSLEKLSQRIDTSKVGLLLLDEAHHVVSEKRTNAVNSFTNAIHYGMTATPWYSPERDARNVIGDVIAQVDIVDAIKEASLAEFKNVLMVSDLSVDLSKVAKDTTGNYEEKAFCKAVLQAMRGNSGNSGNEENWQEAHHYIAREVAKFYHDRVDEHVGPWNGKKCLINCRSQEEARIQAQELNKLFGRIVARVHTTDECDSQTIQDFVNGDLPIVCQVGKLTEGFDMPNLDMTINYPTASFVREAQGAARCIRLPKTEAPMIPPKKMGLVVDIAFKHPAYDNIVDAIRHNKQILFQDVVGIPFVQHEDEELQMGEGFLGGGGGGRGVSSVGNVNFSIISDARELIRLQREANELALGRYVPPIRPGMRTSTDFNEEFGVDTTRAKEWLEACHGVQFYLASDTKKEHPLDLVEQVKSGTRYCWALHEATEALEVFIKMHPEIKKSLENKDVPLFRPGMRTAEDFYKEFSVQAARVRKWLEACSGAQFYRDSDTKKKHPLNLVEWVKRGSQFCLALHEAPEALKAFMEIHPEIKKSLETRDTPPIRPGMRTSLDFNKEFGVHSTLARTWLEECIGEKFYLASDTKKEHPLDLVERVKASNGRASWALHEKGLEAFKKWLLKTHDKKLLPLLRPGMRTSADFYKEFGVDTTRAKGWLEECVGKKFYLASDTKKEHPLDLIKWVKSLNGKACWALHEAPEALREFMKMHPEIQTSLEKKDIPPIRPGMRTSLNFYKKFGVSNTQAKGWLEECVGEKFYLASDTKQEHPLDLVERVKSSGNCCWALHENGLEAFKEWLKRTHGKELIERTSSPTLQKRLEAGSTEGQPKAPLPQKTDTPEI